MFLPYVVEDNIEKKTELNVVLIESLNTINKGNGNKVSSVGIRPFFIFCVACFILKFCHISKVKIWIAQIDLLAHIWQNG
jgi:hypothetical protein